MSRRPAYVFFLLLAAACARQPAPGYDGPLPSARGRDCAASLCGKIWEDAAGVHGGGRFEVGPFGVVPAAGEVLPVIEIRRAGSQERFPIPLLTDGDVADFAFQVTGIRPPDLRGDMSARYRRALGR